MAELTDEQKITKLTKEVATLKEANQKLAEDLKTAGEIVIDLKQQLADTEAGVVKLPTVTVGKDTYELVGGDFTWAGKEVTIEILKDNAKLAQELVKEGVSNLRKVEA